MSNLIPFTIILFLYVDWQRIRDLFFFWWLCSCRFLVVCPFCMLGRPDCNGHLFVGIGFVGYL